MPILNPSAALLVPCLALILSASMVAASAAAAASDSDLVASDESSEEVRPQSPSCRSHGEPCSTDGDCCRTPKSKLVCTGKKCSCWNLWLNTRKLEWDDEVKRCTFFKEDASEEVFLPNDFVDPGDSYDYKFVVNSTRMATLMGLSVFVFIVFLGAVLSVIYLRIKQSEIERRRRNFSQRSTCQVDAIALAVLARQDLPPSYEDVVEAEQRELAQQPPHYKSLQDCSVDNGSKVSDNG